MIPATGVFAPERTFVAVRAIAPTMISASTPTATSVVGSEASAA
jgi:hypothetical protein